MLRSAKSQAMLEYVTYFGITFLVFMSVLIFMFYFQNTEVDQAKYSALNARATQIQTLFYTYAQMNSHFEQNITIKELVNGEEYHFEILANNLYLTQNDLEVIVPLPQIQGNITNKTFQVEVKDGGITIT